MNGALKWKLVAGFVLVFVAGGIAGAALGDFTLGIFSLMFTIQGEWATE